MRKSIVIMLLLTLTVQLSHAMSIESMASIDESGEGQCLRGCELGDLKKFIEEGPNPRKFLKTLGRFAQDNLSVLYRLNGAIAAYFLSDHSANESVMDVCGMQLPELCATARGKLVHKIFDEPHDCLVDFNKISFPSIPPTNQALSQKKVVDVKIKLDGRVPLPLQLDEIKELDVSWHHLQTLDRDLMMQFQIFHNLQKLNLANNKLDRLPAHFFDAIPWCVVVSVANNEIKTIESGAFAGARSVIVNLCGNPIESVEPCALNEGQHKIIVFCSKRLPQDIIDAMKEQLESSDFRSQSLIRTLNVAKKLSSFDGCAHVIIVFATAAIWAGILFPLFIKNHAPINFRLISALIACSIISSGLFYGILKIIRNACEASLDHKKNVLMIFKTKDEKRVQKELFES